MTRARNSAGGRLATLKRRADFLRVAAARRKAVTPGVILQAAPRRPSNEAAARVGYTASRKVGGAVVRNRAKRRLRAAAADVLSWQAAPGVDYVLIARAGTLGRPYAALVADLETALRRVGRSAVRNRAGAGKE